MSVCRCGAYVETRRGMSSEAGREQREERQVEEDEAWPEVDLAERLVQLEADHLRQPVVDPAEEREDEPAHDRVVEVRHHEVAAVRRHVAGDVREETPENPPIRKLKKKASANSIGTVKRICARQRVPIAYEEDEAGWDRDQLRREHVEGPQVRVDPADEQVVLPDHEAEQRDAEHPGNGEPVAPERLAAKTGSSSSTIPKPGRARMYTSGWPKNQNRFS